MQLKLPEYYYDRSFENFRDVLVKGNPKMRVPAATQLVSVGEFMHDTYYIHQGILKLYIIDENGGEKTELFIGKGGLFPLYSPLDRRYKGERDELLVKTQTAAVVTRISQQRLDELITTDPMFAKTMLKQYADFSALLLYDAISLSTKDSLTKICNYLYQYKRLLQPNGINLTQDEIATNIGVPRLTLTRYLKKLRQNKIIATSRKQIEVLDWERLIQLCSTELIDKP